MENNINENKCNKKCKYCNCRFKDKGEIIRYGVSKGMLDAFIKIAFILIIVFICINIISLIFFNIFFNGITDTIINISNNFIESIKNIFSFKK